IFMALTSTTLASAVRITDNSIVVASATGFAPNMVVRIDQEVLRVGQGYGSGVTNPVLRGQDGTVTSAHPTSVKVMVDLSSDLAGPAPQTFTQVPNVVGRVYTSYSANGTITLPAPGQDAVAFLNGTAALTMTLNNPTADMDGCRLTII